jgi:hypothetical protein
MDVSIVDALETLGVSSPTKSFRKQKQRTYHLACSKEGKLLPINVTVEVFAKENPFYADRIISSKLSPNQWCILVFADSEEYIHERTEFKKIQQVCGNSNTEVRKQLRKSDRFKHLKKKMEDLVQHVQNLKTEMNERKATGPRKGQTEDDFIVEKEMIGARIADTLAELGYLEQPSEEMRQCYEKRHALHRYVLLRSELIKKAQFMAVWHTQTHRMMCSGASSTEVYRKAWKGAVFPKIITSRVIYRYLPHKGKPHFDVDDIPPSVPCHRLLNGWYEIVLKELDVVLIATRNDIQVATDGISLSLQKRHKIISMLDALSVQKGV